MRFAIWFGVQTQDQRTNLKSRIGFVKGYTSLKLNECSVISGVKRKSRLDKKNSFRLSSLADADYGTSIAAPLIEIRWKLH